MSTNCGGRVYSAFGICMLRLGPWVGCVCVCVWTRLKLQNARRNVCDACAKCCSNWVLTKLFYRCGGRRRGRERKRGTCANSYVLEHSNLKFTHTQRQKQPNMSKKSSVSKIVRRPFRLQFLEKPAKKQQQYVCVCVSKKVSTNKYGITVQQREKERERESRETLIERANCKRERERRRRMGYT